MAEIRGFVSASQRGLARFGSLNRQDQPSIPAIWDGGGCIDFVDFDCTLSGAKDSRFEVYASARNGR